MSTIRPARYIRAQLSEMQRERSWRVIRERLPRAGRRTFLVPALATLLVLVVAGVVLRSMNARFTPPRVEGATLETRPNEQEVLTLSDGSRVVVGGGTRVRLSNIAPTRVRLDLERGEIDAEVVHLDGRSFIVAAGGIEVGVVGTHFDVQTGGEGPAQTVQVSVTRGRVEVTKSSDGTRRFVDAGETWSSVVAPPPDPPATSADAPPPVDAGAARPAVPSQPSFRLSRRFGEAYDDQRYADAYAELGSDGVARAARWGRAPDLFKIADAARLDGHPREAVLAYKALVKNFPSDQRAGVAGLELGRLLLDQLDDPTAAAEAFDEARKLAPNDTFREDALAHRVQALETAHDLVACAAARRDYLEAYPSGAYAVTVTRRCSGR